MVQARKPGIAAVDDYIDQTNETRQMMEDPGTVGDDIPFDSDTALMNFLGEMGQSANDATVIVYRIDEEKKKDIRLFSAAVTEFAQGGIDEVQNRYGAGEYRIKVYSNGRLVTHRRVSLGEPLRLVGKVTGGDSGDDLKAMMMQQSQMFMAGLQEIAKMMHPQQSGLGMQDTLQLIATLQPLISGRQEAPRADPLDMLQKLLSIQQQLSPPATNANGEVDGGTIMLQALKTFGEPLAAILSQQKPAQPSAFYQQAPQSIQPAQPALAAPPPAENPAHLPEHDEMSMKIAFIKPVLIVMASQNADPYPYAGMVLDTFTPDEIAQNITAPDWWEKLIALIPEAAPHKAWFEGLRGMVIEQLQPEENSDTVPVSDPAKTP